MLMWKKLFVITLLAGFVGTLAACNTMEGAGRDIEAGGDAIQDAAN